MMTPEAREKKKVKTYLDSIGAFHRWPVPRGMGQPDIDCHACIAGQFWGIEVKAPGEEPTTLQDRTLGQMQKAGAATVWGTAEVVIRGIMTWRKQLHLGLV